MPSPLYSLAYKVMRRLWCWLMHRLEPGRFCTAAYEASVVHCWFYSIGLGSLKFGFEDLLKLPILFFRCGTYEEGSICITCTRR